MSLTKLLQGVDIYTLPDSLSRFIQEKTASGFGKLRFVPFAFPVFIMNPVEYISNVPDTTFNKRFKEMLRVYETAPAIGEIDSDPVPTDEIWHVTQCYGESLLVDNIELMLIDWNGVEHILEPVNLGKKAVWEGEIYMREGEYLRFNTDLNSVLILSAIGEKLYA